MKVVAEFTNKNKDYYLILRDQHGKWYVTMHGRRGKEKVQQRLNASEIVRYLANVLEGK